jgi:hypothetical protein
MLFLTYWELNENMPMKERLEAAHKVTASGLFPPKGVKIVRWDMTPDEWGILLLEAEDVADVHRALSLWRVAGAGFFRLTKTAPTHPAQQAIALLRELLESQV